MAKLPRYQQVADTLRAAIEQGQFAVGATLPTETELQERFAVSRFTIREALRKLAAEGLISRRQGSGTVVEAAEPSRRFEQSLGSVGDLLQYAHDSNFRFSMDGDVVADLDLAGLLGGSVGQHWTRLHGIRRMSGMARPLCLTEVYLDPRFKDVAGRLEPGHDALFEQLERHYGVALQRIVQEFRAVALSAADARALGADKGAPALRIVRRYYEEARDVPFEVSVSTHAGDLFTYAMTLENPVR
jgi:GntR family transcriptional regulator